MNLNKNIFFIIATFVLCSTFLFGCKITKDNEPKNLNETISIIEDVENEQSNIINELLPTEKEKNEFQNKLNENFSNNILSNEINGQYILVNKDNSKIINIEIDNVSKNLTTKDNYGTLWLEKETQKSKYGMFYSFYNKNNLQELLKEVPLYFLDTPIEQTNIEELDITTSNGNITKVFEINCIDEFNINYFGYGFIYEIDENNDIISIIINKNPEQQTNIEEVLDFSFNITQF